MRTILIYSESEIEHSDINLSRKGRQMKMFAGEKGWDIKSYLRFPNYKEKSEFMIQLLNKIDKLNKPLLLLVDSFSSLRFLDNKDSDSMITNFLVRQIIEGNIKIYSYENRLIIDTKSTKDQWVLLLNLANYHYVHNYVIIEEFKGTKLDKLLSSIDYEKQVLPLMTDYIHDTFPVIFPSVESWKVYLYREVGGIVNLNKYAKLRFPRLKLYDFKSTTVRAWSNALSMYNVKTTRLMLEEQLNTAIHIKKII